jgi:hypothetical protein
MFTYIHPATGSKTSIDLTICDPSLVMDLSWMVHDDLCGSDHYPLLLEVANPLVFRLCRDGSLLRQIGAPFLSYVNKD